MTEQSGAGPQVDAFMGRLFQRLPDHTSAYSDALRESARFDAEYPDLASPTGAPTAYLRTRILALRDRSGEGEQAEAAREQLRRWADFLAEEFGHEPGIDSLIEIGALAYFDVRAPDGWDAADLLSPPLRAKVDADRNWRENPILQEFVDRLVSAMPEELAAVADDNRFGDHQDVLAYGFVADIAFGRRDALSAGDPDALARARAVFALLEDEFGHDGDIDTVIAVELLENLPYPHEPGAGLAGQLGPKLRDELEKQLAWRSQR